MRHATEDLTAYLDGALTPVERRRVEAHLATCPACRLEQGTLAAAIARLARTPRAAASPAFEQRFYARLAADASSARVAWPSFEVLRRWWLAPGLAGLAVVFGLWIHGGAGGGTDEPLVAEHLELFESYEAVLSVGAVERPDDVEVIAHLDELPIPEVRP